MNQLFADLQDEMTGQTENWWKHWKMRAVIKEYDLVDLEDNRWKEIDI